MLLDVDEKQEENEMIGCQMAMSFIVVMQRLEMYTTTDSCQPEWRHNGVFIPLKLVQAECDCSLIADFLLTYLLTCCVVA